MESLIDWLQQIDISMFGDLSEFDWTNIATYGVLALALAGVVWTTAKSLVQFLWQKTEGFIGFTVSTLVVISLWYTLLRVHVSISFNLDKEVFDNLLWFSAVLFTPYYLIHYKLLTGFILTVVRSIELVLDLLIFSWFPQKAEQNREKWRTRISNLYQNWKDGVEALFQKEKTGVPTAEMLLDTNEGTNLTESSTEAAGDAEELGEQPAS
ncbi:hypothetical protein D0962_29810 [Leptolyngbyaceae cyanobacterium CCMR0082]|uniref:Uncharacterized protein n=2 Tax=Adonisia turfae TaxID=2950184 RepID=A0A6M0SG09_9CYAN|nr:hypothetical protein [Adonisia turfae]MDV3348728.1 hypothetical protein [Leptothoe sp. LEGE 181152]NEZ54525.1 hypothetical protein [Adonisia turfae CCMR0081]NEZ66903.1 hypothetical protein [Adonisia turfae CCMR0082]